MAAIAVAGFGMMCISSSVAAVMMGGEEKEDPVVPSTTTGTDSGADDSGADDSGATTPAATTPPPPAPEMLPNGVYTLRGGRGGKLCADEAGKVICNRDAVGGWEKFTLTAI